MLMVFIVESPYLPGYLLEGGAELLILGSMFGKH
jgi:hypothetical protein